MNCWIDIDTLQQYRNGTISAEEKEKFEKHIAGCPKCQESILLIDMISKHMQGEETADGDHAIGSYGQANARIMARLDRQLYSSNRLSSHLKFLYHKLLPLRRKVAAGLAATACTVAAIAGIITFDRTFGDLLSRRSYSSLSAEQADTDGPAPAPEQQNGNILPDDLMPGQPEAYDPDPGSVLQPGDDISGQRSEQQPPGQPDEGPSGPMPGKPADDSSAEGGQVPDPVPQVTNVRTLTMIPDADPACLTINISVRDMSGNPVNLTDAVFYAQSGKSVIWGRGVRFGGYNTVRQLEGMAKDDHFRISAFNTSDDISFFVCGNNGESQAFYIFDTIKASDYKIGEAVEVSYSLNDLHGVTLDLDFMGRSGGQYEVSVFDPKLDHRETESQGSMFRFVTAGKKTLMLSPGSYVLAVKYTDTGTCGFVSRKIDIPAQGEINITGRDVELDRYVFVEPAAWKDYRYYIIQAGIRGMDFLSYLRGMLDESGSVTMYIDRGTQYYPPRVIYSKNPETEYESSILTFIYDTSIHNIQGESFVPSRIEAYITTDGKRAFSQYFSDAAGSELRFIDLPRKKDMMMEILDASGKELLHKFAYSKYWNYLEPVLDPGKYLVKVYTLTRENGIDGSAEYILTIGDKFEFTKKDP